MLTYNTYVVFLEACELLHSLTDSHTTKGRVNCVCVSEHCCAFTAVMVVLFNVPRISQMSYQSTRLFTSL